ncbi:MAG: FG-GAP-like repeat-containing protein, partial [Saprospiraceae bacterium]
RFPDINDILAFIPEKKIENYLLINNKESHFINGTKVAGMDQPSFSNGSAFADLDADGDLDIIVNNIGEPAFIYRNDIRGRHWLQIDCSLNKGNTDGIGSRIDVYTGEEHQAQTLMTNKGFFSSSEPILHFGLGDHTKIDSIILQWPDGTMEIQRDLAVDKRILWKRGTGDNYNKPFIPSKEKIFTPANSIPGWTHEEDLFVDFKREKLMPYMISREGPCITVGDVNGDQLEDIYAGNGSGFASAFFIQQSDNNFVRQSGTSLENDAGYEDCGAIIEDLDKDGDNDLMVISGGNAFKLNDPGYMTRYYLNDGKGNFNRSLDFPIIRTNAGAILALDYDSDGDQDIIIGGRSTPGRYPESPKSYLLQNEKGRFKDVTLEVFKELDHLGMITDIESGDLDGDQRYEIVFAGEWIPITVFSYDGKIFRDKTESFALTNTSGWWKSITIADIDGDQDLDLFAGNIGLNQRMVTSSEHPVTLITRDFDGNGSLDPILSFYHNNKLYPFAGRDAVIGQVPRLKKKFVKYTPYSVATINDIFSAEELKGSSTLKVNSFRTSYFINEGAKF